MTNTIWEIYWFIWEVIKMTDEPYKLIEYECQDGKCLMIWNIETDSKIGALSLDHRSVGEKIINELNKLHRDKQDLCVDIVEFIEDISIVLEMVDAYTLSKISIREAASRSRLRTYVNITKELLQLD